MLWSKTMMFKFLKKMAENNFCFSWPAKWRWCWNRGISWEFFFFFCENDCLFFCFVFSMFLEGQYSISRINLGILVYIKSRSWHIDTSTITILKKKKTFYFTMRCRKTQFNPLLSSSLISLIFCYKWKKAANHSKSPLFWY